MKILQLVTKRQFRGAEVFAAKLSEQLLLKEIQIIFVGLYTPPEDSLNVDGAINLDLNGKKKFLSWSLLRRLARVITSEKPDIIQANGSDTLKYAVLSRYMVGKNVPIIYRNISIVSEWVGKGLIKKSFYKFLFSKIDYVTSVGQNSLDDLITFFHFPKERARVIRRGIPIHPRNKENARAFVTHHFGLPATSDIVVHVGSFSVEKNHEFLITLFSRIKQSHPDVKLILVGDGALSVNIRQRIDALGLNETIYLAGFRKDIDIFMSAADLLVLCSKVEGVPGVVLEAGAQRTPTLAINVGGISEVVTNNITGELLPDFDVDSFSSSMLKLLNEEPRRRKLGENAFQNVRANFDPVINAALFVDLYNELKK